MHSSWRTQLAAGHNLKKHLPFNTEQRDYMKLFDALWILFLRYPYPLSLSPLSSHLPSSPDCLHDLPESHQKPWALLVNFIWYSAGARSRVWSCCSDCFFYLFQSRLRDVELNQLFWRFHQCLTVVKFLLSQYVTEGATEIMVNFLHGASETAASLLSE